MIKTTSKGSRWELKVKKKLEGLGYSVEKAVNIPFKKTHDFFNCADLIASNTITFMLVAVTSKHNISRARRKLKEFTNHPYFIRKVVYFYDKKGNLESEEVN